MHDPRPFTPREYQRLAYEFLKKTPRANLWADMGLGKTSVILWLIKALKLDNVLIVAPLRVAQEVWPVEIQKWEPFCDLNVAAITGDKDERERALLALPRIATINYDNLIWLYQTLGDAWPFTTVICDESTRLKGFRLVKGKRRALALAQIAHTKATRWINLTGTPATNGLTDLWGQQWFIDGGRALGRSYGAFIHRWFYKDPTQKGHYQQLHPFPHSQEQMEERLRATTLSIRAKEWFDLDDPIEHEVWCELPPSARTQYQSMLRHFYAEIEAGTVTAANCAVKSGKLLQLASGAVYHEQDENTMWERVHDAKLDALDSVVSETNGANLLIVYSYVHERARILEKFKDAVDIHENGAIARWNKGKIRMLLCHPKSAGHGLNLQDGGHHIVYFSPTWDAELYAQVLQRLGPVRQKQSGYERPVYVHHLLARDTVDTRVKNVREGKEGLLEAFLTAMSEGHST